MKNIYKSKELKEKMKTWEILVSMFGLILSIPDYKFQKYLQKKYFKNGQLKKINNDKQKTIHTK